MGEFDRFSAAIAFPGGEKGEVHSSIMTSGAWGRVRFATEVNAETESIHEAYTVLVRRHTLLASSVDADRVGYNSRLSLAEQPIVVGYQVIIPSNTTTPMMIPTDCAGYSSTRLPRA